jgi:hypothetical protein
MYEPWIVYFAVFVCLTFSNDSLSAVSASLRLNVRSRFSLCCFLGFRRLLNTNYRHESLSSCVSLWVCISNATRKTTSRSFRTQWLPFLLFLTQEEGLLFTKRGSSQHNTNRIIVQYQPLNWSLMPQRGRERGIQELNVWTELYGHNRTEPLRDDKTV